MAYNSESVIFDCLDSIAKFNDVGESLEIIVVDNSPVASLEKLLGSRYDLVLDCKYIHNPENGGFGQGNNIGVIASKGETVFFLNPDTILIAGIFKALNAAVERGVDVGGFRLVDPLLNDNDTVGLLPELNWMTVPRWVLNFFVIKCNLFSRAVYPWGAALFVNRDSFLKSGMFDERMFLCNEEPDLIHRLGSARLEIIDLPIIHLEGHTTVIHDYRFREYLKSTKYYFEKHNLNFSRFIKIYYIKNLIKLLVNRCRSDAYLNSVSISKILKEFL